MATLATNHPLTAEAIAPVAVELLSRSLVLARTCAVIPGEMYSGPSGGTVNLRVRQPRTSRIQTVPGEVIDFDDLDETSVAVIVKHHYNASVVSDEDLALNIEDFGAQVIEPMVAAVATGAETEIAGEINGVEADLTLDPDGDDVIEQVLIARELLGRAEVPTGDRWLAVSPEVATLLLGRSELTAVDASGSPSALRDAVIGRLHGFTVVESSALATGTAACYHRSAIGAAFRAPRPTNGAASAVATAGGISLRTVRQFSVERLAEMVAVSTFAGASLVHEDGDEDLEASTGGTERKRLVKLALPDVGSS